MTVSVVSAMSCDYRHQFCHAPANGLACMWAALILISCTGLSAAPAAAVYYESFCTMLSDSKQICIQRSFVKHHKHLLYTLQGMISFAQKRHSVTTAQQTDPNFVDMTQSMTLGQVVAGWVVLHNCAILVEGFHTLHQFKQWASACLCNGKHTGYSNCQWYHCGSFQDWHLPTLIFSILSKTSRPSMTTPTMVYLPAVKMEHSSLTSWHSEPITRVATQRTSLCTPLPKPETTRLL